MLPQVVAGACFLVKGTLPHAFVVLSDPGQNYEEILCANFTSFDQHSPIHDLYNDRACVLWPGDHPFIKQATCICYGCAISTSLHDLESKLATGLFQMLDPVSDAILSRIREGAMQSEHILPVYGDMLVEQGLV